LSAELRLLTCFSTLQLVAMLAIADLGFGVMSILPPTGEPGVAVSRSVAAHVLVSLPSVVNYEWSCMLQSYLTSLFFTATFLWVLVSKTGLTWPWE
jgi:hypothetical protein